MPLAVCEAVEALASLECRVKWPNDVWIEERKVAGVLVEARPPDWAVIGIGLNLAIEPAEFPLRSALAGDLGRPGVTAAGGAGGASTRGSGSGSTQSPGRVLEEFAARDALRGREIRWEGAGAGLTLGVRSRGGNRRARKPARGHR